MEYKDITIELSLEEEFTLLKPYFKELITKESLTNANLVCWVPHEVSSIIQLGWEDGLLEDMKTFLEETAPPGRWTQHDEPDTPFRHNFYQHIRTKLIGQISMTLIVKDGELYLGKYQDLYFYSPVYKEIAKQKILCRIINLN